MDYLKLIRELDKNSISKIHFLFGSEDLFIKNIVNLIKEKVISDEFSNLNYTYIDGKNNSDSLFFESIKALPFFSNNRLIVVRDFQHFYSQLSDNQKDYLFNLISNLPEELYIIFISDSIDKRTRIFKLIKEKGLIAEMNKLKGKNLFRWIELQFKKNGKIPKSEAISLLSSYNFLSMEQLLNEINKISNYIEPNNKTISAKDIYDVSQKPLQDNIFLLIDSISELNPTKSIELLKDILIQGEAPIFVLYMIIRQFRIIYKCKVMLNNNYNYKEIISELKEHPYTINKSLNMCNNFSLNELENILYKCLQSDISIKKGYAQHKLAIEILIIKIMKNKLIKS